MLQPLDFPIEVPNRFLQVLYLFARIFLPRPRYILDGVPAMEIETIIFHKIKHSIFSSAVIFPFLREFFFGLLKYCLIIKRKNIVQILYN